VSIPNHLVTDKEINFDTIVVNWTDKIAVLPRYWIRNIINIIL